MKKDFNFEEYKQYHVHYDVNADGTYTESDEFAKAVNSDQDVSMSRMYEAGLEISGASMLGISEGKDKDINILSAYTLKKNGAHVDAILPTIPNGQWVLPRHLQIGRQLSVLHQWGLPRSHVN